MNIFYRGILLTIFSVPSLGQVVGVCDQEIMETRSKVDFWSSGSVPVSLQKVDDLLLKEIGDTCKKIETIDYTDPEARRLRGVLDKIVPRPYFGRWKNFDSWNCNNPKLGTFAHLLPEFKNVNLIAHFQDPISMAEDRDYVVLDKNGTVFLNMVRDDDQFTFQFNSKTCTVSEGFMEVTGNFDSYLGFTPGICSNLNILESYMTELEKYESGLPGMCELRKAHWDYNTKKCICPDGHELNLFYECDGTKAVTPHRKILNFYAQHGSTGHPYNRRQFNKLVSYCKTFGL